MEMKKQQNGKHNSNLKKDSFHVDEKSNGDSISVFQSKDPIVMVSIPEKTMGGGHGPPVEHPTSFLETLMHLFKGNVGSGMFAMGDAFRNAGLVFAPIITLFLGIICVHSMHLLLVASHEMMRRTNSEVAPDYAETVELVFSTGPATFRRMGPTMRRICNFFLCVTQLGFCCVYFVFVSDNLKQVADSYDFHLSAKIWMVIILFPILLSALVRNLKYLAPLSLVANAFMITGICTTFYFTTQDIPSIEERDYIAPITSIPLYFGTAIFAFEGIGLVLPLRNEMKKPQKFGRTLGVLNLGMSLVTILLIAIGFLSYLKYGNEIEGSVTLNFDEPKLLANSIKIVISSGVLLGYALQFYIPIGIMWPLVSDKFGPVKHPIAGELLFRTLFVCITFALAELIPFLDSFISLVGAVSSTALALIFPPILELVLVSQSQGTHKWVYMKNAFIIVVGLIGFATGTYASVLSIIKKYQEENS